MDIDTSRILLATMITALPTVMTLSLLVLFAFPRSNLGWIRKKHLHIYYACLTSVFIIFLFSILALSNIFQTLQSLDSFYKFNETVGRYEILDISSINNSLNFSVIILLVFPGFILINLVIYSILEAGRKGGKTRKKK